MLQFRLLLATLIVVFGATSSRTDSYPQIMPWGVLFGLCCMPILVAAWIRLRPLAWAAAGTMALLALANILAVDDAARQRTLLELGWVQVVAIHLWIKAARVWYWPIVRCHARSRSRRRERDSGLGAGRGSPGQDDAGPRGAREHLAHGHVW